MTRVLVTGLVVLAVAVLAASSQAQAPPPGVEGVASRAVLTPRIALFGDTVRARVDLVLDRELVDPDSVRIGMEFSPWEQVSPPERTQRDAGTTTYLRTTWTLRCLTSPCIPGGQAAQLEFNPAQVSFAAPGAGQGERQVLPVQWPLLTVYSRFASSSADPQQTSNAPWRAELVSMPAVSYRVSPGVVFVVALSLGALLTLAGIALLWVARPRRKPPAPPPEPEPEPLPVLSPLEQALELLEDSAREDGAEDRRRALELVAEVLEERGDSDHLVRSARVLAWSENDPAVEETSDIAAQVRPLVEAERTEEEEADHVV